MIGNQKITRSPSSITSTIVFLSMKLNVFSDYYFEDRQLENVSCSMLSGNRIGSESSPGMTSQKALDSKKTSLRWAMFVNRLFGVTGTRWLKSASSAQKRRECKTISPDHSQKECPKDCFCYSSDDRAFGGIAFHLHCVLYRIGHLAFAWDKFSRYCLCSLAQLC